MPMPTRTMGCAHVYGCSYSLPRRDCECFPSQYWRVHATTLSGCDHRGDNWLIAVSVWCYYSILHIVFLPLLILSFYLLSQVYDVSCSPKISMGPSPSQATHKVNWVVSFLFCFSLHFSTHFTVWCTQIGLCDVALGLTLGNSTWA